MKKDLANLVEKYLTKTGRGATSALCHKAGISPSTLVNIRRGHIPLPHRIYSVALACGVSIRAATDLCRKLEKQ